MTRQPKNRSAHLPASSLLYGIPLGLIIGGVSAIVLQSLASASIGSSLMLGFVPFLFVFLSGTIAGTFQNIFLRSYAYLMSMWIVVSGVGWLLAYCLQRYISKMSVSAFALSMSEVFLGFVMGFIVGSTQWLVLRTRWRAAYWWITLTVLFWGIAWAAMTLFFYSISGPAL